MLIYICLWVESKIICEGGDELVATTAVVMEAANCPTGRVFVDGGYRGRGSAAE